MPTHLPVSADIEVLCYNQDVQILVPGGKPVVGCINKICIETGPVVTYEVIWWAGLDRKTAWVSSEEIVAVSAITTRIGFVQ